MLSDIVAEHLFPDIKRQEDDEHALESPKKRR